MDELDGPVKSETAVTFQIKTHFTPKVGDEGIEIT